MKFAGLLCLLLPTVALAQGQVDIPNLQKKTEVYYSPGAAPDTKVKLSPEMASRVIEIIGRKPELWSKQEVKALPRGVFIVGKRRYEYYSFLAAEVDSTWGHAWQDRALLDFWGELNRINDDKKIDALKDFRPAKPGKGKGREEKVLGPFSEKP